MQSQKIEIDVTAPTMFNSNYPQLALSKDANFNELRKVTAKLSREYYRYASTVSSFSDFFDEITQIVYIAYCDVINTWDKSKSNLSTWIYIKARNIVFNTILNRIYNYPLKVFINIEHQNSILKIIQSGKCISYQNRYLTHSSLVISNINLFLNTNNYDAKFVQTKLAIKYQNKRMLLSGTTNYYPSVTGMNDQEWENIQYPTCDCDNNVKLDKKAIRYLLSQLTPIQSMIIVYRLGLFNNATLSNKEIAMSLGYDETNIIKIYNAAICRLKDFTKSSKYKRYIAGKKWYESGMEKRGKTFKMEAL